MQTAAPVSSSVVNLFHLFYLWVFDASLHTCKLYFYQTCSRVVQVWD